ncbi:MAG: FecR family protein [Candidatus Pseudobacter hemicellulosilyticus]|uniref:FecR family protein n=1 Tax=Candidatus Pseudobacter hemicellulosilyticus TaxID=3121375 RepID=A0AAJ5WPX0_9BACT|nr:MAG: FecR family protein [Pseudobacter sp.]
MNPISLLIIQHLRGELDEAGEATLQEWINGSAENRVFFEQYTDEYLTDRLASISSIDWKAGLERCLAQYDGPLEPMLEEPVQVLKKSWWRSWPAAAAVLFLVLLGAGWWWWQGQAPGGDQPPVTQLSDRYKNDIQPGGNHAILQLDNEQSIILDSASGSLQQQGAAATNEQGLLVYRPFTGESGRVGYNTISTPRGGSYRVVLPDGSKVWLNAASSIRFPTAFTDSQRVVQVTGEVYFEVASLPGRQAHKKLPFIIQVNELAVTVTGTHVNINAYPDEAAIKTSLLEGSVQIITGKGQMPVTLQPGEQAVVNRAPEGRSPSVQVRPVDAAVVLAWKEGNFVFDGDDIRTIMRQLARWYDLEVIYTDVPDQHFVATIGRNEPVSRVLHLLELTNEVHFSIDGKTVRVQR